jgi:hypothetical protein
MKNTIKLITLILLTTIVFTPNRATAQNQKLYPVVSAITFKTNMRKLWEEHIFWTRNVIFCLVDDLPGNVQAVKRQLQNQIDIGNAIKPYYGDAAGDKLTELLYNHVNITTDIIKAAKTRDTSVINDFNKKWFANADEMVKFLHNLNPDWTTGDLKTMLNEQMKLTADEVGERLKKNYDADVVAFDKVHNGALKMSDTLAEGIIIQFPKKFKSPSEVKTPTKAPIKTPTKAPAKTVKKNK